MFGRQPRVARRLHQFRHRRRIRSIGRREECRRRAHDDRDVLHLGGADLVDRVEVGVVIAIGEVPVEQRRHPGGDEHGVIAAAFVRVGAHDPFRVAGAPERDGKMQIVEKAPLHDRGINFAGAPFRMRIGRPLP